MVKAVVVRLMCCILLRMQITAECCYDTQTSCTLFSPTNKTIFSIFAFGFDSVTSGFGLFSGPFHWRAGRCMQLQKRGGLAKPAICVEFSVHWRPCVRATFKNDHSAALWSGTFFFPCTSESSEKLCTYLTPFPACSGYSSL